MLLIYIIVVIQYMGKHVKFFVKIMQQTKAQLKHSSKLSQNLILL